MKDNIFCQIDDKLSIALWIFINKCNFSCNYCGYGVKIKSTKDFFKYLINFFDKSKKFIDPLENSHSLIRILRGTGRDWVIGLTGGEPFLYPKFVQLCEELIKYYKIYVDTNLSITSRVREFAEKISPEKVEYICVSVHIKEWEKRNNLETLIKNILLLEEKKFNLYINYVMHPALIDRFKKDYDYFKSRGIIITPRPVKTKYGGKNYPQDYSDSEKELILKHDPTAFERQVPIAVKGRKCDAGKTLIVILSNGDVTRCIADKTVIGSIFKGVEFSKGAEPCRVDICTCYGYRVLKE